MAEDFDLLGDPIPEGWGKRGRPPHIATTRNRSLVMQLQAFGKSEGQIANALGITIPTLKKHYFRELKAKDAARDRVDGRRIEMLWDQCRQGNVAAMKEYGRLIEKNDIDAVARSFDTAVETGAARQRKGKKEVAQLEAESAGSGTDWGDDLAFDQPRLN